MSCLSPWHQAQGERSVGKTAPPPMIKISLRGSVTRNVGSIPLRDVGFGITFHNPDFGGGALFPGGFIRTIRSVSGDFFLSGVGGGSRLGGIVQ